MTMPGTLIVAALLLLSSGAEATAMCRWVDEASRTQIAEVVPDKYRKGAVRSDSQRYELSPAQREAAEQQIADDKAKARRATATPPANGASGSRLPRGRRPSPA